MRVRTEEKRQEILGVAAKVFRETGYADTSMAAIAARIGGSKSTLYGYFDSKEELFVAVMVDMARRTTGPLLKDLKHPANVRQSLEVFMHKSMLLLCSPEIVDFRRMLIGEGAHPALGKLAYEQGGKQHLQHFADLCAALMREGRLREADPWQAALHMYSLCYGPPVQFVLEGIIQRPPNDVIQSAAKAAADFFLRAYSVPGKRRGG